MAKKKDPSIYDALDNFKSIVSRASLNDYFHVNGFLISINPKDVTVILKPDKSLMIKIREDEELNSHIKEIDINKPEENKLNDYIFYVESLSGEGWYDVNCDDLYAGKVIKISIDGFTYSVLLNKNSIPVKLRKAEFNNVSYRVYNQPKHILCLQKRFEGCVEDGSFSMMRLYQIL